MDVDFRFAAFAAQAGILEGSGWVLRASLPGPHRWAHSPAQATRVGTLVWPMRGDSSSLCFLLDVKRKRDKLGAAGSHLDII